jgi:hypothetical protein
MDGLALVLLLLLLLLEVSMPHARLHSGPTMP